MHPWFFSMGRWHLGQGLVLAMIQCTFSLSALFFMIHRWTTSHTTCIRDNRTNTRLLLEQYLRVPNC
jgi:hypothetical protein